MTGNKDGLGSDLLKIDLYENSAADYVEIPEITDEDFSRASVRVAGKPLRGRPPKGKSVKQLVSLRLDPEIQARFRSGGPGWQTRMNTFLLHNEALLKMIVEFDEFIEDMEKLIEQLRSGHLRTVFEPVEASITKVERNIRTTKRTVGDLREQLVWEPAEPMAG